VAACIKVDAAIHVNQFPPIILDREDIPCPFRDFLHVKVEGRGGLAEPLAGVGSGCEDVLGGRLSFTRRSRGGGKDKPVGSSFVSISDRGFWVRDSLLELWLRLLALHIEDPVESGTVATTIRDQWLLASRGEFGVCVPDGLEEAVSTGEGAALVRAAVASLLEALAAAPSRLGKDVFNLMGFSGGTFTGDIETRRLIEVGRAFLDLMDGKITSGPGDTSFMPGSQ
jgi:hypothetical protein